MRESKEWILLLALLLCASGPARSETAVFTASLLPGNEVAPVVVAPADLSASGTVIVTLYVTRDAGNNITTALARFDVAANGFSPGAVLILAHIHQGPAGVNGPVRVDSGLSPGSPITLVTGSDTFTRNFLPVTPAVAASLLADPAGFYFNVHTILSPGGAIRGQLQKLQPACPHHRVHGHISTAPPDHSFAFTQHHGQHGHTIPTGSVCLPHVPGHSAALMPEPEEGFFAARLPREMPDFVSPARPGSIMQLFGPALGLFLGESDDQSAASFTPPGSGLPLYYTTILPQVRIGGQPAQVLFSGLAPGLTGVWQINILVPSGTPGGWLPVTIHFDGTVWRAIDVLVQ